MGCFEKWVYKIEKVGFYAKIDRNFPLTNVNALRYMGFYYYYFKYLVFTINIT